MQTGAMEADGQISTCHRHKRKCATVHKQQPFTLSSHRKTLTSLSTHRIVTSIHIYHETETMFVIQNTDKLLTPSRPAYARPMTSPAGAWALPKRKAP